MKVEKFILEFWADEHETIKKSGRYTIYEKPFLTPADELTDDEIIAVWKEFTDEVTLMFPTNRKLSLEAKTILLKTIQFALVYEDFRVTYDKLSAFISRKDKRTLQKKIKELEDLGLVSAEMNGDEYIFKVVNKEEVNNLLGFDYFECD